MSKRGKSKRSHRCAVFLSVVLCAGLFTGCGDKKAVEISTGSTAAEKDVRDPYDGQSIDEQPNITETDTPPAEPHQPLWKMQHRKMWITVKRLEA